MKKIIILLATFFFITGCTPTYKLEIGNVIKEEINIPLPELKKSEIIEKAKALSPIIDDFNEEYNYKIEETPNNIKLSFEYNNKYSDNIISNQCFEKFDFTENYDYVHIKATGAFGCLYDAEKIDLTVKTDYFVQSHNSSNFNENEYTWTISSENRDNVNIEILANKKVYLDNDNNMFKNIFKTFMIVILIIGGIFLYYSMSKHEKTL